MSATPGRRILDAVRALVFAPIGYAGSLAASRYVGGTTAGTPAAGAYRAGDIVPSHDGTIGVCRVTGSPGAWSSTVTNNTDQTISGTKTFSAAPVVPSLELPGGALTVVSGRLYVDGRAVAFQDELAHSHAGATSGPSAGTAHTHTVSL